MERIALKSKDKELDTVFNHVFNNAMNVPINSDSEPTSSDIKVGCPVIYSNTLYLMTKEGILLKFAGVVV